MSTSSSVWHADRRGGPCRLPSAPPARCVCFHAAAYLPRCLCSSRATRPHPGMRAGEARGYTPDLLSIWPVRSMRTASLSAPRAPYHVLRLPPTPQATSLHWRLHFCGREGCAQGLSRHLPARPGKMMLCPSRLQRHRAALAGSTLRLGHRHAYATQLVLSITNAWHPKSQYQWPVAISMPPTLPGVFYLETLSARCAAALLSQASHFRCPASGLSGSSCSSPSLPGRIFCRAGVAYVLQATGHTKGALKRALRSKVGLRVLAPPPLVQPVAVQCSMVGRAVASACTSARAERGGDLCRSTEHNRQRSGACCCIICAKDKLAAADRQSDLRICSHCQPLRRTFRKAAASAAARSAPA